MPEIRNTKCEILNNIIWKKSGFRAGFLGQKDWLWAVFYPGPVKNNMQQYQSNKCHREIEMNIAPLMPSQRPQIFNFLRSTTTSPISIAVSSTSAGRENILDYKACKSKAKQVDKAKKINNIIQCGTFHEIFTLKWVKKPKFFQTCI